MSLVNQKIVLVLVQPSHAANTVSVKLRGSAKILLQSININWMKMVVMIDFYVLLLARFCLVIILTTHGCLSNHSKGRFKKYVTRRGGGGGGQKSNKK